jgi:hypothetical protein
MSEFIFSHFQRSVRIKKPKLLILKTGQHLKTSQYIKELALIAGNSPLRIVLDALCHTYLNFNKCRPGFSRH